MYRRQDWWESLGHRRLIAPSGLLHHSTRSGYPGRHAATFLVVALLEVSPDDRAVAAPPERT